MLSVIDDMEATERAIRSRVKDMAPHATEIGKVCVAWSYLELDLTLFLHDLCGISNAQVNNVLLGIIDLREKIKALTALGFAMRPNDEWYALLSKSLNYIDSDLRPKRNRLVHDFWVNMPDFTTILRMQFVQKIVNVQSRTKELRLAESTVVTPDAITAIHDDIVAKTIELAQLRYDFRNHHKIIDPLPPASVGS
jgi:hypothetical protein